MVITVMVITVTVVMVVVTVTVAAPESVFFFSLLKMGNGKAVTRKCDFVEQNNYYKRQI
jgi:hypothetical protein